MRTLPDYLRNGLRVIFVGCNPGERSVRLGHYYAGRGNQFWPMLYDSGIIPEPIEYEDDRRLLEFGVGLTDLVKRPTRGIEELGKEDYAEGRVLLGQKLDAHRPRVLAFNGKIAYEQFSGRTCTLGLQAAELYGARVFVLPSTSGRNASMDRGMKRRYFRELGVLIAGLDGRKLSRNSR
jgi:mismatch-specific thymine-DNA glycosylase